MTDILALDIETANYSHEIGGWDKTAMFEPTVVATWDGECGVIYCNKTLDGGFFPEEVIVKELHPRVLGEDIEAFVAKGGRVLGHNIRNFDLPILRDALDCWAAGDLLGKAESIVDTSILCKKVGLANALVDLDTVCKHTLLEGKSGTSLEAPLMWKQRRYDEVAAYCLKDSQLVYRLWKHGCEEGVIKSRCRQTGNILELEVEWT
jgi:hypothetical protein